MGVLQANNRDVEGLEGNQRRLRYGFHVSKLIAECGHGEHRDQLTRDLFDKLTDKNLLPYMESKAAVRLLSLDAKLPKTCSSEERRPQPNPSAAPSLSLSCLQFRCSQSITQSRLPADEELAMALSQVPSYVLIDIVMRVTSETSLRGR